jgi:hypothetical protein
LDGTGVFIALVAQKISSTAEFLDRNGVASIKPDAIMILGAEIALALRLLMRPSVGQLTFEFVQRIDVEPEPAAAGSSDGTSPRHTPMTFAPGRHGSADRSIIALFFDNRP